MVIDIHLEVYIIQTSLLPAIIQNNGAFHATFMFGMHGSSSKRVVFASKKKFHNHFRKSLINLWVLCLFDAIKERSFPFPAHISPKSKILKILGPSNEQ